MNEYVLTAADAGERIDAVTAKYAAVTRSASQRLIEEGLVTVDGEKVRKNRRAEAGELLTVEIPAPIPAEAQPENIPLNIVYEDDDVIVVNKPKGMVVHPAAGNETGTLVNALLYHCGTSLSGIGGVVRPGIVHRIDKDTSGLLMVAKNDEAHLHLSEQIRDHSFLREYRAIAVGNFRDEEGTVDAPIARHPTDRKRMAVVHSDAARDAVTHYRVLERFSGFTYLACRLETGRTHQIRVHMSSLGHPLLGDTVYGGGKTAFEKHLGSLLCGQCLFAAKLGFVHPKTGEFLSFEAPLPAEFEAILEKLRHINHQS